MKVSYFQTKTKLSFKFEADKSDQTSGLVTQKGATYEMGNSSCYFEMPSGYSIEHVHPDLVAAAILMMVEPYVGYEISMEVAVSRQLADYAKTEFGISFTKVNAMLKPRQHSGSRSLPGLCFSGGVDSTAALMVMPKETVSVFLLRDSSRSKRAGKYRPDAALASVEAMRKMGHEVKTIKSDFEFLRNPVGFAWGISSAVPVLLLADHLDLNSVAFGMVLESAYGIGDNPFRPPVQRWRDLMSVAGLPYSLPVAGVTEVGTSLIVASDPRYGDCSQSCIRGLVDRPCNSCVKCFRKSLGDLRRKDTDIEKMLVLPGISSEVTKTPVHHKNVYAYYMSKRKLKSGLAFKFSKKVRSACKSVGWNERWFDDSKALIYPEHSDYVANQLRKRLKTMNFFDRWVLRSWNPQKVYASKLLRGILYRRRAKNFRDAIESISSQPLQRKHS